MKRITIILAILLLIPLCSSAGPWFSGGSGNSSTGTLTNGKWCTTNGTLISCTEDAPAGSGDVTDVGDCASGNCSAFSIGGIALGDTTPDANGEIGYATNAFLFFANSEDFKITAGANMWTLDSNTSAAFTITPALTVTGALTASTSVSTPFIAIGTDPADAGSVRLPNAGYILSEADAAGTDISVIGVDSSEVVQIGASGASGVTVTPATTITGAATLNGGFSAVGTNTVSNAATSAGSILFKEDSDNGTNTAQLIGPASTADVIITLPATTGTVALTGLLTLNPSIDDHAYSGTVATMTAGENLTIGQVCYLKSDGKWWLSDADASTTMPTVAMATGTINADATGVFLLNGFFRDDSGFNWTIGGMIYAGSGATSAHMPGAFAQAAPNGSGDQVQIIGYGYTADIIYFNPSITILGL